jgi:hypothetical protein
VKKERFRTLAMDGVEKILSIPDDIWEDDVYPLITMTVRDGVNSRCRVIVGMEEVDDGKDRDSDD